MKSQNVLFTNAKTRHLWCMNLPMKHHFCKLVQIMFAPFLFFFYVKFSKLFVTHKIIPNIVTSYKMQNETPTVRGLATDNNKKVYMELMIFLWNNHYNLNFNVGLNDNSKK